LLVAVAAGLVGIAVIVSLQTRLPEPVRPVYRDSQQPRILSLLPDDAVVSREEPILRWTPLGDDARYTIEVDTLDLVPVASAHGLSTNVYRLPDEVVESLAPGTSITWRVEARLLDGRRIVSEAFIHRID